MSRNDKIIINHGISTSQAIYDLFRKNCQIIRAGHRYFPMCVQVLKLDISPEFTADSGLTYMADCLDCHGGAYSVLLSQEFASELNKILVLVSAAGNQELLKEYLGLFPMVANDRGLGTVSIDLVPGGVDECGAPITKNKFFITYRVLDETYLPGYGVYSTVWEFEPIAP
jgi:hypothetical protein